MGKKMNASKNKIDLNALKFNQASIIFFTVLGSIADINYLPAFTAAVMLVGSLDSRFALFKQFYRYVIVPSKLVKTNIAEEASAPHNFAQTMGGIFLAAASIFLFSGQIILGWIFVWAVILLAAANLVFGFCLGCFIYFQLGKLGVPGFNISHNN
jgi:hypothetical protein